ncbi:hypothetical protein KVT40_008044 [Elsinoe batatas]|uniref:Mitochondrial integral membrane protein n=1 Tax=Elsinoe batatas TaxID=2601811 RepID=A0A8K0PDG8_9PEZI|nr:hypothetical protein KVT40_008044 [Elsinoe batatas]
MVSLWGSKKPDGEDTDGGSGSHSERPTSRPPPSRDEHVDERAPLLQQRERRQPHSDGYLDPDDPAVSPYNLWSVRLMRHFTVLFLAATFIWWVLLLVSIFVTPPGLNTRGSGFFDFSFTTLTAGNLLLTLLFFTAPSRAMRILLGVVSLLLFVDMIIIVSVHRLIAEESWPGIASAIWAFLMGAWCVVTDRVVAWGKREEEERLTGRAETRRTVSEWFKVLIATIVLAVYVAITVFMTATLIIRATDAGLQFPGERIRVDSNKYDVHLACVGNVTHDKSGNTLPTVLLEAGEQPAEYELVPWAESARKNGTLQRYCYWDRPGYAWSDNAPSPHSAGMSADALSEALAVKGETGPWVLVSAGYGSVVSRIFSSRHTRTVTGLLLIDPLHEDLLYRLATPGRGFLLWAYGIISPLGIQRVLAAIFAHRTREDRVYGEEAYQGGKFIKAQLQENLIADSLTKSELVTSRAIQDQNTPFVIISSHVSIRRDNEWERKQRDMTHLTDKLVGWDVVEQAPHEVWRTYNGRQTMEKRVKQLLAVKATEN